MTKYIKIEDDVGRADADEGSISFSDEECFAFPGKIPIATFNNIEFKCASLRLGEKYLSQYFVFCMSTVESEDVIGDSQYVVELHSDIFETFEMLLSPSKGGSSNSRGTKFFSHGPVQYYDIHNHPDPLLGKEWREVYVKRSNFKHQHEYRAALFASEHFFNRVRKEPMFVERSVWDKSGKKMDFNLRLSIHAGIDADSWRYVQFDISEFSKNLKLEPSKIRRLS